MNVARLQLQEIAESVGYGVTASACDEPVGPKFLRITDIQNGQVNWNEVPWCDGGAKSTEAAKLRSGDIVFARTGATTGKSFLIGDCPENAVFASYLIRVRLRNTADPGYVSQFFQTADYWGQITKSARGVAQPGVNATTLKALRIPLPPLPEQKRIAGILDAADALRQKRRESLAQLDTLLQSTFLEMFGDPVTNPMGWKHVLLSDLCERIVDCPHSTPEYSDYPTNFYCIRSSDIQRGALDLSAARHVSSDTYSERILRHEPQAGEVVYTREGGRLGLAALVTPDHRMVGYRASGHPAVVVPAKMNDVFRGTWNAGESRQGLRIGALDEQYVRQVVCIQADGSVSKSERQVRFGFTKLRKIKRIQKIFSDARERSHGAIATGFVVSWKPVHELLLSKDKHFNVKNLLRLPLGLRQAFLDELQYWDSRVRQGGKSFSYSTVVKHNADAVAAVCAITGWKASVAKQVPKKVNRRDCYTVCIKKRAHSRSGTFKIDELPGSHTVHCLSMPSSFVIARDNGKNVCVGQCNFGVPGGLGAASLVAYAKQSYGVELTIKQAKSFRQQLITQVYPELSATLRDTQIADMACNLHTSEAKVRQAFAKRDQRLHASRIVAGCAKTPEGAVYEDDLIAHVWLCLQQLNCNPALQHAIAAQEPSNLLMRRIFYGSALAISGRLRGHVGFSQKANTPFQGLAADGNKLALYRLLRAGFQVCGFIHNEMLILIPDGTDYDAAVEQVQKILASAMQELAPDIPIRTEYLLADRWYKDVDEQPRNGQGRIVAFQRTHGT